MLKWAIQKWYADDNPTPVMLNGDKLNTPSTSLSQQQAQLFLQKHWNKDIQEIRVYECHLDNENYFRHVKPWMNYFSQKLIGLRMMHTAIFVQCESQILFINYTAEGLSIEQIQSDEHSWAQTESRGTRYLVKAKPQQNIQVKHIAPIIKEFKSQKEHYHQIKHNCQDFCKYVLRNLGVKNWLQ